MNRFFLSVFALLSALATSGPVAAKGAAPDSRSAHYIVVLEQAPLAEWHARGGAAAASLEGSGNGKTAAQKPRGRLDVNSAESRAYLDRLETEFRTVRSAAEVRLGRSLEPRHQYRHAVNGFSADLTAEEAREMAALPGVKSVRPEEIHKLETDAGPPWIGAGDIWAGVGALQSRGEGIVVGVIDSGINWEHESFQDRGEGTGNTGDPYDHDNPYGSQLGLCSQPEVLCNDKLVGVYDFVTDDPNTDDVVEETTDGFDNDGHGSHVASTAVGNTLNKSFTGFGQTTLSGVAPNANMVAYRVCFIGDPDDSEDDGCQGSAILAAIDQAIADGVDVINYSIGSTAYPPWTVGTTSTAFLNAVGAGIFVVTSAGNKGPGSSTLGAPANAPWVLAAANASHNRVFGTEVTNFSGGELPLPSTMVGASRTGNSATLPIVHASDYGFPLCGDVTEDAATVNCSQGSSASNPFPPGTFNGEIVVCDRGTYGRVEKGLNVKLGGAGGYILANSDGPLQSVVADTHCLPAAHVTQQDGDVLRSWLSTGSDHRARISESRARGNDSVADILSDSSSRGPAEPPVQDVLKPNLMTPGSEILGAYKKDGDDPNEYVLLSGTSMASPHVAGAAALLRAIHPDWDPSMVSSALETTATDILARNGDGSPATPFDAGAGRPVLQEAVEVGLYLQESEAGFRQANPDPPFRGDPGALNLAGLANSECRDRCSFTRTVTSRVSSRAWTAGATGFPEGVSVTVTPSSFTLGEGQSQQLDIEVDLGGSGLIGQWVYGKVTLEAAGSPDQALTAAVFASGGTLPEQWTIDTNLSAGNEFEFLTELSGLPDLTLTAGGLTREITYTEALPQDPTANDPYDGSTGTYTILQDVPAGSLWLHTETLASSAVDLDLYVGRDANGDGRAQESEELCSSLSPEDIELCDLFNPVPGTYWILVQNWDAGSSPPDNATLVRAVIGSGSELELTATAQGITATDEVIPVRLSWNNVDAVTGESLLGAVGVGTDRDNPNNIGIIPVQFNRTGIEAPSTQALVDGRPQRLAMRANSSHDRIYIDVPESATSLTVSASGASASQSDGLSIELKRVDFDNAFNAAPEASPAPAGSGVASASGGNGNGPQLSVTGAQLVAGRWYVVLSNTTATTASVEVQASVEFTGGAAEIASGLWEPASRPGINQGFDYAMGAVRAFLWYTYDDAGLPAWYLAAAPEPGGDIWVADLLRFTNDGAEQQSTVVGQLAITTLAKDDVIFSWQLFGVSGSDRMRPLSSPNTCPDIGGEQSYTGIWYRGVDGLGGASVLINDIVQGHLHYLYDATGTPRWLLGNAGDPVPDGVQMPLFQFAGYCPNCTGSVTSQEVGVFTIDLDSQESGSWTLDYLMGEPLAGDVNRTDNVVKLTQRLACE